MKYNSVLIIDDDWDDIEIFRQAMMKIHSKIECTFMIDAKAALADLQVGISKPDVIFLDVQMFPLSGQDFLRLAKADPTLMGIPIYMFSTHSNHAMISDAAFSEAVGFITKPSDFNELVKLLGGILLP